jgi:hypothetical protein
MARLWKSGRFKKNIQTLAIVMMIASALLYLIHYCMNPYSIDARYESHILMSYIPVPITVSLYNVSLVIPLTSIHTIFNEALII